jgi:hypothetical protein
MPSPIPEAPEQSKTLHNIPLGEDSARLRRESEASFERSRSEVSRTLDLERHSKQAVDERELDNFFPWPPPPASARTTLPPTLFSDRRRFTVVGDASGFLESTLRRAGFDGQWSYFKLPDERAGFGLISQMEQIDAETGKPLPGAGRWTSRVIGAAQMPWWSSLVAMHRPVGHYRVFVFMVSTKTTPDKSPKDLKEEDKANLALARYWASGGKGSLTGDIAALPMTPSHRLTVRLYEFSQEDKGKSILVQPASLTPMQHLASAGINLESNQ